MRNIYKKNWWSPQSLTSTLYREDLSEKLEAAFSFTVLMFSSSFALAFDLVLLVFSSSQALVFDLQHNQLCIQHKVCLDLIFIQFYFSQTKQLLFCHFISYLFLFLAN